MFASNALLVFACVALGVHAHGMPKSVSIAGTDYPGASGPGANPSKSPFRPISTPDPRKDLSSIDMACGADAAGKTAGVSATAKPGDVVKTFWQGGTGINWFHNVGPILTYMTSCNGDCASFQPSKDTNWFKVDEQGPTGALGSPWAQAELLSGAPSSVTIPKNMPSGNYLFRQELITLQNGAANGGAEFYPACMQLTVSGGSSSKASFSPSVHFPGTYTATDPGILVDVYTPSSKNYQFPGGPVANIAKGSSPAPSSAASEEPAPTSVPANAAPSPSSSEAASAPAASSTKTCSSKKRSLKQARHNAVRAHRARRAAH